MTLHKGDPDRELDTEDELRLREGAMVWEYDPEILDDEFPEVEIDFIRPSPENTRLYRPIDPEDPENQALARSIAQFGVQEPVVITDDYYIVSGHRRHACSRLAGLDTVPCRVVDLRREDDIDGFVRLLREYNRQRVKTFDEVIREEVVSVEKEDAYRELLAHRDKKSDSSGFRDQLYTVELGARKSRSRISAAKKPMLDAVRHVLEEREDFWPLSDRQIHYGLLNTPPLRHAKKPASTYRNDVRSYKDLCDLLTRARLEGFIPWDVISDDTRPVSTWNVAQGSQVYIRSELDVFLRGYRRDLQQSQPNHIEVVAEKLTVQSILAPVAKQFCVPLTVGRGYASIPPRHAMVERYRRSGRENLIVLLISDFDPDGENIAESFARSLRDDFGVEDVEAFKVALTADQVARFGLPPRMKAKAGSSTRRKFVAKHGEDVFELEAIPPKDMQDALAEALNRVIDTSAFNAEVEAEKGDATELHTTRARVVNILSELGTA